MKTPSFTVGQAYRIVFDNDEVAVGKYLGKTSEKVIFQRKEVTINYVLFDLGTEVDEDVACPMTAYYETRDMVEVTPLAKVAPVLNPQNALETLWEEAS